MASLQPPLSSGFGAASTAAEVIHGIDLSGKVAIVTGGYSGIGLETTRVLRAAGAKVIVPARDHDKASRALQGLDVEISALDLGDPTSIEAFAHNFLASGLPLHMLVNNAGIMACPLTRDTRGYESQFATNHLGHFALTTTLWPALQRANGARVVSVSSLGHRYARIGFDDPHFERREYDPWIAYGQSKTANILFAVSLDRLGAPQGIRAFSLHPGTIVSTDLPRYIGVDALRKRGVIDENGNPVLDPSRNLKTIEQGAATSVWCATSPQLNGMGGLYCENVDVALPVVMDTLPNHDNDTLARLNAMTSGVLTYAIDPDEADRLWALSENLTGRTLPEN